MKNLKKKIGGGNGFTLVEMLIVVAIIAILIAISIPLINNALDKAKHATDAANERAAKAEILIQYMSDNTTIKADTNYYYNATDGSLVEHSASVVLPTKYGKHKASSDDHTANGVIMVRVSSEGVVKMEWVSAASGNEPSNAGLCSAKAVGHT